MVAVSRATANQARGGDARTSRYLQFLPSIYQDSDFMNRFLLIFEDTLSPLEWMIDNLSCYFDPALMPPELLPWLADWVNVVLDESSPVDRRRQLLGAAVRLFQWRGTKKGLQEYLKIYTGVEPEIQELFGGLPLDGRARLGFNTVLGSAAHNTFKVIFRVEDLKSLDEARVRAIIEAQKPAHAAYILDILLTESQEEAASSSAPPAIAEASPSDQT